VIGNVGAVFAFEWKRALTWSRMLWWLGLALFPMFIMAIIRINAFNVTPVERRMEESWQSVWRGLCAWLIFALIPMLVSMLGTLLWTTPAISAELERRSWVYLAVRPHGGTAVLLGKYLAAVTWVIPSAILGLSIAVPLAGFATPEDSWRIWWSMTRLVLLSAPAYAAIYLLIGVVLPRRAMVVAVAYTLIFELLISFVPAIINKMTVQYRLRSLAAEWCDISFTSSTGSSTTAIWLIGNEPAWQHIAVLIALTVTLLVLAVLILRATEFSSSAESDT
jgi:ABC-type transport system involved in multi-copper enzyme maturation permease subunit